MTLVETIYNVTEVVIALAALFVTVFILSYSVLFDPTKTTAGKLVRSMMIGLLGLCLTALSRDLFEGEVAWALFRLGTWLYCCAVFALMVWLVFVRRFRVEGRKLVRVEEPIDPLHPTPDDSYDFQFRTHDEKK